MKKIIYLILFSFIFFLGLSKLSYAQMETDEKAYLNFEDGIGFLAPDTLFGVNMRFRMQNRAGLTFNDDWDDAEFEALVKRCRLRFDGFVGNKKLTYYLQLSFSRGDQDWDNSHVPNIIRDAMVYYKFNKYFYIGLGQGKLPGNRQRVTSSGAQQFAERSIVNSAFNIDRDFGIFAYYNNKFGNNFVLMFKGAITTGEGRNIPKTDNGLSYTTRIELLPFGSFTNKGDYFEGDLEREKTPKLSIASTYSFNNKAQRTIGQRGTDLFQQRDIESIFADLIFKYNGWCAIGEYAIKNSKNPITIDLISNDIAYIKTGTGLNTQLSYLFKNNIEIAGRYSHVEPSSQMAGLDMPYADMYTLGLTKYINEHRTKVQFNISKIFEKDNLLLDENQEWNIMFQVEIGI